MLRNAPHQILTRGHHRDYLIECTIATITKKVCPHESTSVAATPWWGDSTAAALATAGTNRAELERALVSVPVSQRGSMVFLVENMPDTDRTRLSADFLLRNTALAHEALEKAPWRDRIGEELFRNEILPYAAVNEDREDWREKLRGISLPLIEGSRSPGEAARRLNEKLFPLVKVKYSTKRRKPDQGPLETMGSGVATCTGLSILLIDACRSVGVPARLVGTPMWANLRGNHTWVEIWDGDWHFAGAAEPDGAGLDRGWFVHDASEAKRDVPKHAIYASSFRRTGVAFPMIWARDVDWVPAVNVTERYAPPAKASPAAIVPGAPGSARLLVKVIDKKAGQRVIAKVRVHDLLDDKAAWTGTSRGETADLNDILPFEVPRGRTLSIETEWNGRTKITQASVAGQAQEVVVIGY